MRAPNSESDGTAADAKTGDKNGGRRGRKVVAVLHGGGLVQAAGGEQAGCLAGSGGLAPTHPTNGGIARGGRAEWIREGVTGHLPLEWVAPHEVGAGERLFPTDEVSSEPENETIIRICDTKFPRTFVKAEDLEFRVEVAMPDTKPAHDVAVTIKFHSAHRIKMIEGDVDVAKRLHVIRPPEERFSLERLGGAVFAF